MSSGRVMGGGGAGEANLTYSALVTTADKVHQIPGDLARAASGMTAVIAVTGTLGNVFTVTAVVTTRELRRHANSALIGNLSLAGALYCVLVLPAQALTYFRQAWLFGRELCELHSAANVWLYNANMALLSCIAFYRYLRVVHPGVHACVAGGLWFRVAVLACWSLSLGLALTPVFRLWGQYAFRRELLQCSFRLHGSHKIAILTLAYVIPFTFVTACYSRVACHIFAPRRRLRSVGSQTWSARRSNFKGHSTAAMMTLVFLGFFFGMAPSFLVRLFDLQFKHAVVRVLASMMSWIMYNLTPVFYTLMDSKMHAACRRLLGCRRLKKTPSETKGPGTVAITTRALASNTVETTFFTMIRRSIFYYFLNPVNEEDKTTSPPKAAETAV